MKILQIIHKPQSRGAEIFTCQLSGQLTKIGHKVKIISVYDGEANLPWPDPIESLSANSKSRFIDFKAWKKLAIIIKSFKPCLVQVNAGDSLKYAVLSKNVFKWTQPIVVRNASEVGRYLNSRIQKSINVLFYKSISKVISVSHASKKDLLEHFPFLRGKIEVIQVGLENAKIKVKVLEPTGIKHILHVGGFTFEKNHEGLLRIFKKVQEKMPNVHLHLVGDGPERVNIERKVEEFKLEDHITFYGFVNDPLSYINSADILVLPSIIEGLPGVILEAMYCKTPVVAYNVGGVSEVLNDDTGILILKNDESSFAGSVLDILIKNDFNKVEEAFNLVRNHYMNDQIALKFVNSYQKLVEQSQ
ncbi:glycosyltransferase [Gramella jeungdoensis]|uniref:Glycosyltransferase n=1 Tax=Gramella jeungdoensis TaxID=708091 RepID=A0ABT0Z416_9FLAO|nr:glycosyltransferase [Gramella jeungdoensis]MCM8570482.1 glycosyltransferase [Gramella jeungdoensis]